MDAQTKGYLSIKWDTTQDLGRSDEGEEEKTRDCLVTTRTFGDENDKGLGDLMMTS